MASQTQYSLSAKAYALPILHAARHPSSTTTGLFLSPSTSSSSSSTEVQVTEAVPLQHVNTTLSPYTELGLEMVDKYAEGRGMRVVGMCVARDGAEGLGRAGERILGKLKENYAGAFALEVDNERLGAGQAAYKVYLGTSPSKPLDNTSESLPSPFILESGVPTKTLKAIREGKAHRTILDLDNHLEDSSADWLENKETKEALGRYLA